MKRRYWKVWVAGIALVLMLLLGVVVSLLWPEPSGEAGRVAKQIHIGMMYTDALAVLDLNKAKRELYGPRDVDGAVKKTSASFTFEDRSEIMLQWDLSGRISLVSAGLPRQFHPLTRLRRTLARVLPFLGEK
jgi:hypothetical protein